MIALFVAKCVCAGVIINLSLCVSFKITSFLAGYNEFLLFVDDLVVPGYQLKINSPLFPEPKVNF